MRSIWETIILNKRVTGWILILCGSMLSGFGGWLGFLDQTGILALMTGVVIGAVYNEVKDRKDEPE